MYKRQVFLIPALALIAIYMIYPVIDTFITSGYKWNGISSDRIFVGLDNWKKLLTDGSFLSLIHIFYLGDNTHIENCIVESRDTIRANSYYVGEDGVKIVIEKNERYVL